MLHICAYTIHTSCYLSRQATTDTDLAWEGGEQSLLLEDTVISELVLASVGLKVGQEKPTAIYRGVVMCVWVMWFGGWGGVLVGWCLGWVLVQWCVGAMVNNNREKVKLQLV